MKIALHIPKNLRYTIGSRIENRYIDLLELTYQAYFSKKEERIEKITKCILLLDLIKFLIQTTWEAKIISHQHYEDISVKLDEIGRMLGGWRKSLDNPQKKNRTL